MGQAQECYQRMMLCHSIIILLFFLVIAAGLFTGCRGTNGEPPAITFSPVPVFVTATIQNNDLIATPEVPTPSVVLLPTDTPGSTESMPEHFNITFEQPWHAHQDNALRVQVPPLDHPFILAVELVPQFDEMSMSEQPTMLDGTPVAGNFAMIVGTVTVRRVVPGDTNVPFVFPSTLFELTLAAFEGAVTGWELRAVLISEILVYPVSDGRSLGERMQLTPQDIPTEQTWIESEVEQAAPVGPETDAHIVIPRSHAGMFLYYPYSSIVDTLTLSGDPALNFQERSEGL